MNGWTFFQFINQENGELIVSVISKAVALKSCKKKKTFPILSSSQYVFIGVGTE